MKITSYATASTSTKVIDNPTRKKATAAVSEAEKALAAAERDLAALLADPAITPAAKNTTLIPAAQKKITAARNKLAAAAAARDKIPAKLTANVIDPEAKVALLRTRRRGLQMVLQMLAHNAEHWLSNQLNAYLRDDDEYRAITRQTIIRGLAGTITYAPAAITVTLQPPGTPRITRALALLIDEINATPPSLPGDQRPITYQLANPAQSIQNPIYGTFRSLRLAGAIHFSSFAPARLPAPADQRVLRLSQAQHSPRNGSPASPSAGETIDPRTGSAPL